MAYQTIPPGEESSGITPDAVVLARVQSLLGETVNAIWGTHFFDQTGWSSAVGGSGVVALSATSRAGVLTATTGASAGSQFVISPNWTATTSGQVENPRTTRWYARTVAKVTTAIDSQSRLGVCELRNNGVATHAAIGVLGASSTTHFYAEVVNDAGVATTATTGIAVDTGWHIWEIWGDLTNINFAIDEVTVASIAVASVGTAAINPRMLCQNGTTAAARTVHYDAMYVAAQDNAP